MQKSVDGSVNISESRPMKLIRFSYRSYSGDNIPVSVTLAQAKELFRAIRSPRFSHARTRNFCRQDCTSVYHYDTSSPSGFLIAGGNAGPLVEAILERCKRTSSLSPTEPR